MSYNTAFYPHLAAFVVCHPIIFVLVVDEDRALAGADAGKSKAETCAGCHGENCVSQPENTPSLASQPDQFLQWQLGFFRSYRRSDLQVRSATKGINQPVLPATGSAKSSLFDSLTVPSSFMLDPGVFDTVRLPSSALLALDSSGFHAVVQPWHYLLRALHILSAAGFFGGIMLLDLRLIGVRSAAELKAFSADVMPWLYIIFGIAIVSGILLFLYDPPLVASRAYFVPKIVLVVLGVVNAALYNRFAYEHALTAQEGTPFSAKCAGALSIAFWVSVMLFSSMNIEGVPKTSVAVTHSLSRAKVTQFDGSAH